MNLSDVGAIEYPAEGAARALIVLGHGAGAGQRHPFMTAVASGFAARGIDAVTFDFPYMRERRHVPDRAPVLEKAFLEVVDTARRWSRADRMFIGGKSMGGRMATHLGAAGVDGLRGIIVFGYPLHPPGRPERLRADHLPSVKVPVFIVQGARDTFGTPEELAPVLETMPAGAEMLPIPGGDHSLTVRGRREGVLGQVLDAAAAWIERQQ